MENAIQERKRVRVRVSGTTYYDCTMDIAITICFKTRDKLLPFTYNGRGAVCDIDGCEYFWYR
jgi:hypothetical protein